MRVTLLGHASLLVEADGACIAMDPVFLDPFEHGLAASCPARTVDVAALPTLDAIILSHGHTDHYDPRSLALLSRATPVYIPNEPSLVRALAAEGFADVRSVVPGERLHVGGTDCLVTGSVDHDEFGVVFADGSGSLWNQVDTAATQAVAAEVAAALPRGLDVAICPYCPLLEHAEVWVDEVEFPLARYERLLESAIAARARVVVPGSCGQRLVGAREWLNQRVFPVTREQFLNDLHDVAPQLVGLLINPGEAVVMQRDAPVRSEATPYARVLEADTWRVAFQPELPAPLRDDNPDGVVPAALDAMLTDLMGRRLSHRVEAALQARLVGPLRTLWDRRAVLQIEFAVPGGQRSWHLAQWQPRPLWLPVPHPDPDYVFGYVASELWGYLRGRRDRWQMTVRARRRALSAYRAGGAFRFSALEPARLHGEDPYLVVDEDFAWNPLMLLEA